MGRHALAVAMILAGYGFPTNAFLVRTTVANEGAATKLATRLVNEKGAACVHVQEIRSTYRWKGKTEEGQKEWLVEARFVAGWRVDLGAIVRAIEKDHPYEVPLVEVVGSLVNRKYRMWAKDERKGAKVGS